MCNVNLKIGDFLSNSELSKKFTVSTEGGMRFSTENNILVLITKIHDNPYPDRWEGNKLYYIGMGRKGDQSIDFQSNKKLNSIYYTEKITTKLVLFINTDQNKYLYCGEVKTIGRPYFKYQYFTKNEKRKIIIFPLIVKNLTSISSQFFDSTINIKSYKNKKEDTLIKNIDTYQKNYDNKNYVNAKEKKYYRNPYIAYISKKYAKGICQLCQKAAPFQDKDGNPYLESHHIEWLSRGGKDRLDNVIALCPNCHKKMHIIDDKKDVKLLQQKSLEMYKHYFSINNI
ncbi:hypothetical protein JG29_08350 [Bombilactobacillus mellis]|uniref:HNH nuclease domain-containing protein n=1 Tax=Bombilactobacillus mellis TaxID=1218508 RepID=A0A0F4KQ71_9LACO|nr:HNH endonuclease [Bombilactobacillus mellis]KJY48149.1 hypothetical protein JG29_08350 [Bombilactobacillus mellis]